MRTSRTTIAGALLAATWAALAASSAAAADEEIDFARDVRPLLERSCFACHGADEDLREADLRLDTEEGLFGDLGGYAAVVPGSPEESELWLRVSDTLDPMPPPDGGEPLSAAELALVKRWIAESGAPAAVTELDVLPFLHLRCAACHGARKREAGLDLRTRASMLAGGESGPALVPGAPEQSPLLRRVEAGEMPPHKKLVEASVKVMLPNEVDLLRRWIAGGALESPAAEHSPAQLSEEERGFWSFQPPRRPEVPRVGDAARVRNPVDAFVLARLEGEGLSLAPEADPRTLLRRATFDLTGLPPTPEETQAFLADDAPGAYERLVDRLLASPRYGERWARRWLDVAGYSDSEGVQHSDPIRPQAWRYRDYVISSLNADKPYDRFLTEQLAGDELFDHGAAEELTQEQEDLLVATGFLRMAPDGTFANITNFVPDRLSVVAQELEVLTSATMGLTFKCARCHDHKFDPVSQREYYGLAAVFKGAFDEHDWLKPHVTDQFSFGPFGHRYLPHVDSAERAAWEARDAGLTAEVDALSLAIGEEMDLGVEDDIAAVEGRREPAPAIRALWDRGEPSPTFVLSRGEYLSPGDPVGPGVPAAVSTGATPYEVERPWPGTGKTGRRLALARWLAQPDHPLTARVVVNRVWSHHFGRGIVETLDDFGRAGARPSHPALLDWLAVEFPQRGWSLKELHRLLVTSSTYRQSSAVTEERAARDPENRLLSRMPLGRLDAEALYDSLLFVAGRLDPTPFGPADAVDMREDGLVTPRGTDRGWRRSVYVLQRRTQTPTLHESFDLPQMSPNCVARPVSTVSTQALHLLNNGRVHELAADLAARVGDEAGPEPRAQVERLYALALARPPTPRELELQLAALGELEREWDGEPDAPDLAPLANLCHAILNTAEFRYVD